MTSEMTEAYDAVFGERALAEQILADLDRKHEQHLDVAAEHMTDEEREAIRRGVEAHRAAILEHAEREKTPAELYNEALLTMDGAIGELRTEVAELKRKPPKPHRTGAAARMNPDDIRLARGVLAGVAAFGAAAFVVSFGGQLAMASYTQLQPALYWFVPFMVEAPIILLSFMIAVFRRRKQSTAVPWALVILLTLLSSAVNVAHVWLESGGLPTIGDALGAVIMGSAPWLVLVLFEEFVRLSVKPTIETPEPQPAARKTPTKKGPRK